MTAPIVERSAVISDDGLYRYELVRRWGPEPTVTWVMLNPSTADDSQDDQTMRQVQWFSQREGYGGCVVLNLFALRSRHPTELGRHMDPVGPGNLDRLSTALASDNTIIVGWGAHKDARRPGDNLRRSAKAIGKPLWCLGATRDGYPCHPVYLPHDRKLEVWSANPELPDPASPVGGRMNT